MLKVSGNPHTYTLKPQAIMFSVPFQRHCFETLERDCHHHFCIQGKNWSLPMIPKFLLSMLIIPVGQCLLAQDQPVVHHYFSKSKHEHAAEWGYSGEKGPAFWGQLDLSYRAASDGRSQSPIDINSKQAIASSLPELKFAYRAEKIASLNNGHTIQHNDAPGSYLYVGEEKFALEQFHLHAPSEHSIDGKPFDMEIHFVHKSASGKVAVVGVLVQKDENAKLDIPLFDYLPEKPNELVTLAGTRNPSDFLPRTREYYLYTGSFTTPPCTEPVQWIVLKEPIQVPPKLVERFSAILQGNRRPIQKLNERVLQQSK